MPDFQPTLLKLIYHDQESYGKGNPLTPEGETELIHKVDKILNCLTGDPLANPPQPGLIQRVDENTIRTKIQEKKIEKIEGWKNQVKMRIAWISGALAVIVVLLDRAWDWVTRK